MNVVNGLYRKDVNPEIVYLGDVCLRVPTLSCCSHHSKENVMGSNIVYIGACYA